MKSPPISVFQSCGIISPPFPCGTRCAAAACASSSSYRQSRNAAAAASSFFLSTPDLEALSVFLSKAALHNCPMVANVEGAEVLSSDERLLPASLSPATSSARSLSSIPPETSSLPRASSGCGSLHGAVVDTAKEEEGGGGVGGTAPRFEISCRRDEKKPAAVDGVEDIPGAFAAIGEGVGADEGAGAGAATGEDEAWGNGGASRSGCP